VEQWTHEYAGGWIGRISATGGGGFLISVEPPGPIYAAGRGLETKSAASFEQAVSEANSLAGRHSVVDAWIAVEKD
jgi:hypothetical protein